MFSFVKAYLNRPNIRDRKYTRVACEQLAELVLVDRRVTLNGMLVEISKGGALFREASRYILDRRRMNVVLRVAGLELPGVIVNVRDVGYGILFDSELDDDAMAHIADGRILGAA